MKTILYTVLTMVGISTGSMAQQNFYDLIAGNGNGLRFWQANEYKIHMGAGPEYQFGPVTDYSIKMNMSGPQGRGWTWGGMGSIPIAALNTNGNFQIAGSLTTGGDIILPSVNGNKQIYTWSSSDTNWRIGMSPTPGFTTSMATGHVQYLSYYMGPGQGFAIGVNEGQSSFEVTGNNHNAFFRGNVGIGTANPSFSLDIEGLGARVKNTSTANGAYTTCRIQGPHYTNGLEIDFFGNNNISSDLNWSYGGGAGSAAIVNVNAKPLTFGTNNQGRMIIDAIGNVGIGTSSPNQKLTVNGTIYGKEIKVDLAVPGPDYVFEKNYSLPSLEEVKDYIAKHKHLPDVPSAKDMEANGINLSEMNMLLLKKVEELTLYMIDLKRENEQIKEQLKSNKNYGKKDSYRN